MKEQERNKAEEIEKDEIHHEVEAEDTNTETQETAEDSVNPAEEQLKELNDKYIRLYSEFDNYRKRTNKEKIEIISSANADLLTDLIPTLDDFERAIENNTSVEDMEALKEGFVLIYNKFKSTLEAKGLKQMVAKGLPFDSDVHDAIANIPAPTPDLVGCVVDDVTKGYYLNEKVIRHAKVVVGQ